MIISKIRVLYYQIRYKLKYGEKMGVALSFTGSKRSVIKSKIKFNNFLEEVSKKITPNKKSTSELIDYLVINYGAEKYKKDHRSYNRFLLNLLNTRAESLNKENKNTKDVLKSIHESKIEFENYCLKLDKDLSEEVKNIEFIAHFYRFKASEDDERYVTVDIEEISESLSISCGSKEIVDNIFIYLGVTKKDIDTKSDNFKRYALALKDKR